MRQRWSKIEHVPPVHVEHPQARSSTLQPLPSLGLTAAVSRVMVARLLSYLGLGSETARNVRYLWRSR